ALRAFLRGERQFAALMGDSAADAYRQAVEADSTFWLAWWRLNEVRVGYLAQPGDTSMVRRYRQHRAELPERERAMIEIAMVLEDPDSNRAKGLQGRLDALLRRYPDYWRGWWSLADLNLHRGFREEGVDIGQVRAQLERTVELNPGFLPAWNHLAEVIFFSDSSRMFRIYDSIPDLFFPGQDRDGVLE